MGERGDLVGGRRTRRPRHRAVRRAALRGPHLRTLSPPSQRLADRVAAVDDHARRAARRDRRRRARSSRRAAARRPRVPRRVRSPARAPVPAGRRARPSPGAISSRSWSASRSPSPRARLARRAASSTRLRRRALLGLAAACPARRPEHLAQVGVPAPRAACWPRRPTRGRRPAPRAVLKSSASASKKASRCTASSSGESPRPAAGPASRIRLDAVAGRLQHLARRRSAGGSGRRRST